MILECSHCGAPLDIKEGASIAKCGYCDKSQRVRNMNTLSQITPAQWQQPTQWVPPPSAKVQSAQALLFHLAEAQATAMAKADGVIARRAGRAAKGGISIGCVMVLLAIGGIVAFAVFRAGGPARIVSRVNSDGLDPEATPALGIVTIDEARFEHTVSGTTAGTVSLSGLFGEYPEAPTANLRVRGRQLVILTTHSQDDTAILVRGAHTFQRYDDDSGGSRDARLVMSLDSGIYPIWVGSRAVGNVFDLHFSTRAISGNLNADGLVPEGPPTAGQVTIDQNSPTTLAAGMTWRTTAEDAVETRYCGARVAPVPNVILHTTTPTRVTFATRSDFDATLLLRDPSGTYTCDDDSGEGNNAQLTFTLPVGDTALWAGLRTSGPPRELVLGMTLESATPPSAPQAPGRPARRRTTERKRNTIE